MRIAVRRLTRIFGRLLHDRQRSLARSLCPAEAGVKQLAGLLLGKKKPPAYVPLATRGSAKPPTLLSPRNTKMITSAPSFQWMGMDRQEGTVKVFGPDGLIWTAENIALTQIRYPPRLCL